MRGKFNHREREIIHGRILIKELRSLVLFSFIPEPLKKIEWVMIKR